MAFLPMWLSIFMTVYVLQSLVRQIKRLLFERLFDLMRTYKLSFCHFAETTVFHVVEHIVQLLLTILFVIRLYLGVVLDFLGCLVVGHEKVCKFLFYFAFLKYSPVIKLRSRGLKSLVLVCSI